MPLDVDFVAARVAIENIQALLMKVPHGKRACIADDIIEFTEKMEEKYKHFTE